MKDLGLIIKDNVALKYPDHLMTSDVFRISSWR